MDNLISSLDQHIQNALDVTFKPETYSQLGVIILIYTVSYMLSSRMRKHLPVLKVPPVTPASAPIKALVYRCGKLLTPIFAIMLMRIVLGFSSFLLVDDWVIQTGFAIAVLMLFSSFINLVITNSVVAGAFRWIGMPILILHLVGVLDNIVLVLESMSVELGNIKISAYGVARTIIFGSLLFWLGRISNNTGKTLIRNQLALDFRTKEIVAKLFEILLFLVFVLLLLHLMGINLTALAVFGGALGVGLGFGLQSIASNFISGVIIIFDRSLSVGDYVGLEDGRAGKVTELNMRSTTLETYDGKNIVVPNEQFITSSFTNWTRQNEKQRYRVDFSVGYKTDVRSVCELIKEAVASHPQVLSGPDVVFEERPDCEIDSFGDSGVNMFVEFWMEGIDDGRNRVGGDLLLIILETLQENGIEIPYPQREVRIVGSESSLSK
ncbi:mechanosensitive ion channel [Bermanella marisrubri]|uniref:Mechanosensitive ion channel family protein n=1 Tax=Bermanella marisrubri TaxID=207949 RepID=Q1N6N9_9GAMM|nr:mechanosensitive ion channel domain-containing protein [Bermanella marisrubri]EAT13553.1 mechanosensitive ion channel family protein [Oceanobacter sp. RED65] [Bermanella marisrubri]QIZ84348.1 mechanosensitive ion channel [Bermanella marisrubri]